MAGRAQSRPPGLSPLPDENVPVAVMYQEWRQLTFVHWRYEAASIRPLLPPGLEVDTFDGSAWVGLTPFVAWVRLPHSPRLFSLRFPETNVRTYVRGPDGKRGVWFFSLDAARRSAVAGARLFYGLPYRLARMDVTPLGRGIRYRSQRVSPDPGPESDIEIQTGDAISPVELTDLHLFLTARWRLYTLLRNGRIGRANVEHPPWPLVRARVVGVNQTLLAAAGLDEPRAEPMALYSPGVTVRIGPPRL